jgi:lysophospholipase L1-like esterase
MLKKLIAFVAILLVLSLLGYWLFGGNSNYPITNAHPTGKTIIAFGDSLTEGKGAGKELAYPAILSQNIGVPILNMGISGNTTADGLNRLKRDVLDHDPKIVLLGLGGNDFLQKRDKNATFDNLRQIIEAIQQTGALVILISVDFPLGGSWTTRYRELARQTGCPHVPDQLGGLFGHPDLMSDEIHPNAKGYAIMAQKIQPVLQQYLNNTQE